jgi:hydroxymethylpyrimidine pyrophosphatase-like HAD family hydrolase
VTFDAIISDIDGCLGPESDEPLPVEGLARIARHNRLAIARRDRPILTVCSGRPLPFVEAVCRVIANDRLPAVCENGVWLYDPHRRSFERDPRITAEHVALVHDAMRWVETDLGPSGVVIQPGKSASMSLWHPDTEFLFSLLPLLRDRFAAEHWPFRVSTTIAWINCDLDFVSKATGVERLMRAAGLTRERAVFVGDAPGDLVVQPLVALFAAPANCHEQVKSRADLVTAAPEVDGVLELLARFSPGQNTPPQG